MLAFDQRKHPMLACAHVPHLLLVRQGGRPSHLIGPARYGSGGRRFKSKSLRQYVCAMIEWIGFLGIPTSRPASADGMLAT